MNDADEIGESLAQSLSPDVAEHLLVDPVTIIEQHFEVQVRFVPRNNLGHSCGIEGLYRGKQRTILVADETTGARLLFTLLHELGHHLLQTTLATARLIAQEVALRPRFEEDAADGFAAELLVPNSITDEVLARFGLGAPAVAELAAVCAGSRWACCTRIGQRLGGSGYVLVALDGTVEYARLVGSAFPLGRGTREDAKQLLSIAQRHGHHHESPVRLIQPSGVATREYAGQAHWDGERVYAVFTDHAPPPWGGLTGYLDDHPVAAELECGRCLRTTRSWKRCQACRENLCHTCGWCGCQSIRQPTSRLCSQCFTVRPLGDFDGPGDVCHQH